VDGFSVSMLRIRFRGGRTGKQKREPVPALAENSDLFYVLKKSKIAFFMTCRPTSAAIPNVDPVKCVVGKRNVDEEQFQQKGEGKSG
jgi:hypothetical protein